MTVDNKNNNKRKSVTVMASPVNSVVSYASTSSSSMTSSTMSGSSNNNNWLPPISSLLSHIHDSDIKTTTTIQYDSTPSVPYYHILDTPETILPKQKKRKTQPKPQSQQKRAVYMPMIPYYFHHEKFGIEACMLQLEGQKKFNNHFYI